MFPKHQQQANLNCPETEQLTPPPRGAHAGVDFSWTQFCCVTLISRLSGTTHTADLLGKSLHRFIHWSQRCWIILLKIQGIIHLSYILPFIWLKKTNPITLINMFLNIKAFIGLNSPPVVRNRIIQLKLSHSAMVFSYECIGHSWKTELKCTWVRYTINTLY